MTRILIILAALMVAPMTATAQTVMLMAEEPGCYWCALWDEEIGPIYDKTAEGRQAPLQRFDILSPPPDVVFIRDVHFTPTFIVIQDGAEVGRIEGYPGDDFFWGLLGMILDGETTATKPAG
ncbi:MAG: hypothetical protein MK160_08635 [Rhodobacteraceae bacterium]|nr:hypothetical protein [Paracoccaceae bacterium]